MGSRRGTSFAVVSWYDVTAAGAARRNDTVELPVVVNVASNHLAVPSPTSPSTSLSAAWLGFGAPLLLVASSTLIIAPSTSKSSISPSWMPSSIGPRTPVNTKRYSSPVGSNGGAGGDGGGATGGDGGGGDGQVAVAQLGQ